MKATISHSKKGYKQILADIEILLKNNDRSSVVLRATQYLNYLLADITAIHEVTILFPIKTDEQVVGLFMRVADIEDALRELKETAGNMMGSQEVYHNYFGLKTTSIQKEIDATYRSLNAAFGNI